MEQFLSAAGWTVVQRQSWRAAALAYGWTPQAGMFAASPGDGAGAAAIPTEQEVQFLVAVRTF